MINTIEHLLAFGTVWFWIIVAAWSILLIAEVANEVGHAATWTFIIFLLFLQFGADVPVLTWPLHHPIKLFLCLLVYLVIGVGWSFVKWVFYLYKIRDKMNSGHWLKTIPQAKDHKNTIILWMAYWPWSMVWTLLNDPIVRAFKFLYGRFEKAYQHISDSIFKGVTPER